LREFKKILREFKNKTNIIKQYPCEQLVFELFTLDISAIFEVQSAV
jgi:hypothetical protein